MADDVTVSHDEPGNRFVIVVDGQQAVLEYRLAGTTINFYHTYVPIPLRGRQLAERLCKAAFEHAKSRGLTVIPSCSYVSGTYLKRHPEYRALVKTSVGD